jgi:hypothetical protein
MAGALRHRRYTLTGGSAATLPDTQITVVPFDDGHPRGDYVHGAMNAEVAHIQHEYFLVTACPGQLLARSCADSTVVITRHVPSMALHAAGRGWSVAAPFKWSLYKWLEPYAPISTKAHSIADQLMC